MDYVKLGERVRYHRKLRDITQEALAEKINVSTSFIGHIERGTRKLSVETLVSLADALEVSCDLLLQDSLDQNVPHRTGNANNKRLIQELVNLLGEYDRQ